MKPLILIPVKDQARAKARMLPALSTAERGALAWAMFEDVARAVRGLDFPAAVVTDSARAAGTAREWGWGVVWEDTQISESHSVDEASRRMAAQGFDRVLRLPADVPLVKSGDIKTILEMPLPANSAVLVPSRDWFGTNALLRRPPTLFPSRFGFNSLTLHVQEARRVGAAVDIVVNERISVDLDEVDDIMTFLYLAPETSTRRTLERLGFPGRIVKDRNALHSHLGN